MSEYENNVYVAQDGSTSPRPMFDNVLAFGQREAGTLEEIDASMSRHPAGKKRRRPPRDICGEWISDSSTKQCTREKAHDGKCVNFSFTNR